MFENSSNNSVIGTEKSTKKRSYIATNTYDLASQAQQVGEGMKKNELSLKRFTADTLIQRGQALESSTLIKVGSKSKRTPLTMLLNKMQADAHEKMGKVKIAMQLRFPKTEAQKYYGEFGIEHSASKGFTLPKKYEAFLSALKRMQNGIQQHQIESDEYGLAYWQKLHTDFERELNSATSHDTTSSEHVGETQKLRAEITSMLRSVIHLVMAEEPEDYERILHIIGFRREKLA